MTAFSPCAIIPVYDNAATVGEVALAAAERLELVIVVDDGSTDGSGDTARAAASRTRPGSRIEVLGRAGNRGKGEALVVGLRRAKELGRTHAVTLDADGQHRASDIPALIAAAQANPLAVIVGARDMAPERVPNGGRVGMRISNFWTLRSTGFELPDTTCGFRVYPVAPILDLPIVTRRYDYEGEVIIRAAWAGLALVSLPIDVWYPDKPSERVSHYLPWVDSFRITVMYVRLALRRLLPMGGTTRALDGVAPPKVRLLDTWRHMRDLARSGTRVNELALAIGVGVFIGATPLWGIHAALMLYIAVRWRLNLVASFLATNVSFPLFAPFLVFAEVQFGHVLRRGQWLDVSRDELSQSSVWSHAADYIVGGFAFAALLGITVGLSILKFGSALQRKRRAA